MAFRIRMTVPFGHDDLATTRSLKDIPQVNNVKSGALGSRKEPVDDGCLGLVQGHGDIRIDGNRTATPDFNRHHFEHPLDQRRAVRPEPSMYVFRLHSPHDTRGICHRAKWFERNDAALKFSAEII